MSTNSLSHLYNLKLTLKDILKLLKSFSIDDKIIIEKELEKETIKYRAKQLSKRIKPNKITMDEIVYEVKDYRQNKTN
ncbi:MAG: hypothetical protein A2033_02155 [Bacteroidetes bacterium GWA2_31_9]|nr:MAG: hypothetical protein A2033_02155 [Bacteroidetes bacterium GWA2_31_9]